MQCKYLEYLRTYEMLTKIGHNLVQTVPRIEQEEKGLLQPRSGMQISCRRAKKRDRRKRRIGLSEHGIAALFVARHRSDRHEEFSLYSLSSSASCKLSAFFGHPTEFLEERWGGARNPDLLSR